MNKKLQYLALSALVSWLTMLLPRPARAYTTVNGNITSNTTWTSGNTYFVTAPITVVAGVTLTVEDSVVVKFAPGTYLAIRGNLEASAGTKIRVFSSRDDNTVGEIVSGSDGIPAPGDWQGLNFYSSSSGQLANCTVSYATYGIWGSGAFPTISHCTLQNNGVGIYADNTTPNLSSPNNIQNNTSAGIHFMQCSAPVISNQTLSNHTGVWCNSNGKYRRIQHQC